ncbi:SPFH domain-containing protein [Janibacter melonis]|uniref:SPFH domain-containing protein n=1 Tax=Janibacter melonis TaxID=262209 RepID=UPI0020961F9D|nr:SPFH domain-containing protein [Janibacter melonis]
MESIPILVFLAALVAFALVILFKTVRIVPQQTALIIERLGRYSRTLEGGIHILVPFVDKVRANIDLREQVVSFPPQPVITSDNLVVNIDTVIYYTVIDAKSAVYEIANFIQGIEQLTVTTLRNVIGSLDLEQTLTSRDQINGQLRGALDEATGRWGIRVNRVELKAIDPPMSIQESMEKQMKAERDRRAAILNAEGTKQSAILTAEGEKQSQILRAEGSAQARILEAQGQARAIQQVFDAIHRGKPTQKLLAYQYLQVLPQIARGDSNKMWIIPSEVTDALKAMGGMLGGGAAPGSDGGLDDEPFVEVDGPEDNAFAETALEDPAEALKEARGQAGQASREASEHATPASRVQPSSGQGQGVRLPQPRPASDDATGAGAPAESDATAPASPPPPVARSPRSPRARPPDRPGPVAGASPALSDTPSPHPVPMTPGQPPRLSGCRGGRCCSWSSRASGPGGSTPSSAPGRS